jgi:membrane fusion protein, copper/silver efflux system
VQVLPPIADNGTGGRTGDAQGFREESGMRKGPLALVLLIAVVASFLAGTWVAHRSASNGGAPGGREVLYYVCPMHPGFRLDHPGDCGTCGMRLEPVYADGSTGGGSSSGTPGTVALPQDRRQAVGVAVGKAERAPWTGTLRLVGRVAPDEARTYTVNTASDVWLRKVFPPTTGSVVKKHEPLAAYFTSGYLAAANAYLFALDTRKRHQQSGDVSQAQVQNMDFQMRTAVGNLINIGVSESQILEMEKTGKASELVEIRSPADGFILARSVTEGQYVSAGSELYRIADLAKVWILAETYEGDGNVLKPGMDVKVIHPQVKRTYRAKVTEILPQFDPETRTMKVRLEADNPGYALRPDMFVDLEVSIRMAPAVTVPAEAVVDTGTRKTVFVDRGDGRFEPRPVETGWRMGGRVEITNGLMEGEEVVVSGNFLIDSESRMQLAAAGIQGAWHVDPVCAMHVDEGKAKAAGNTVDLGGITYYFCSNDCAAKFRKEPAKYLRGTGPATKKAETARGTDGLPIDPVCGMAVDLLTARAANRVSEHEGKTYYFCSDECKKTFDKAPASYARK